MNHRCGAKGDRLRLGALVAAVVATATVATARGEELAVAGLRQPVEIVRDRWGIAHIYARDEHDLFLAQGYNAARDRLFQLELWRRRATGTMAEIQGPRALAGDIGARLLEFRGDMDAELNHYHPRGAGIVGAFVRGINAYIERTEREPARLPIEFRVLGIKPGRWTPEVVVSRHNGLYRNVGQEVEVARLVRLLGPARARDLLDLHPGDPRLEPDRALDVAILSDGLLERYRDSRAPVRFRPEDVGPAFRARAAGLDPARRSVADAGAIDPAYPEADPDAQGSNNWVIAGARTSTGAAIMANDPHRNLLLPSLRYWVHLIAPGWDVIGAGEPALPGVSVGHNEHGAWGFTIFPADQEDLYVYETDLADPSRYRYRGGWEAMRTVRETFAVKGAAPVAVDLMFTRHGPVVAEDRAHHRAYAIRAAWLEPGGAPYLASLRVDQASTWAEFREACRFFYVPSENMIWADRDGHIGWQAVGLAPRREGWDGLLPVPGDGRYEWAGFLPVLDLPHLADPPRGYFASANQDNLPPGYPFAVSYQWTEPFRFQRIEEVLGAPGRFALADSMRLQHDELSLPARSLVPMLRGLKPARAETAAAADRLLAWDFVMGKDSIPAAIYATWERQLKESVRDRLVPADARRLLAPRALSTAKLIGWLKAPDGRFGADPIAGRDVLLLRSLDRAVEELARRLGPEMDGWRYGQARLKHVALGHPLSDAVGPELRARLDVGPIPRGGYGRTVNNTSDNDNQTEGATFRIIADAGDWDRSVGTNAPGQSGDPDSPHYRDLFGPWAEGRYFPVSFSRPKVEAVAEERIILIP
jgi:penicillin G amidase